MSTTSRTRRWAALSAAMFALGVLVASSACSEDFAACYEGDYLACACPNGASGFQQCNPALDGYGVCVCDGRIPGVPAVVDAGREGGGDGGGGRRDATMDGDADAEPVDASEAS